MTVILVDPRRPSMVPVEAIELLVGELVYTEEIPPKVPWSLPSARPVFDGSDVPVLLSSDPEHPAVIERVAAGENVIAAPSAQRGERLIDAVALMDKLRSDGPWESEQTHDSLRRYLLEETYELFDAVRGGNADDLRDELGDVLLQVLFHARIAEDAPQHPFTIDDVADALLRKLGNRVPGVIAGQQISLEQQIAEWDERKAQERAVKSRGSCLDGVPTGQPALALAQKVIGRVTDAGLPADLIPAAMTTVTVAAELDAENSLRSEVLEFMDMVQIAERTIAATRRGTDVPEELDSAVLGSISEEEWRAAWPVATEPAPPPDPAPDATPEPSPGHIPEPGPAEVPEPSPVEVPEPSPAQTAEDEPVVVDVALNGQPNNNEPQ
ncbi:MAG: nucleoside triphosphate diphosphatase [Mycobacterium sp.]|jgi:XTP/dITP diphosphohydrolase|nr:nucleoside triphosphate diphosphatase [Mycobacterium sp.]